MQSTFLSSVGIEVLQPAPKSRPVAGILPAGKPLYPSCGELAFDMSIVMTVIINGFPDIGMKSESHPNRPLKNGLS